MPRLGKRKRMLRGDSECAYCGKVPATTVDHVVPRGFAGSSLFFSYYEAPVHVQGLLGNDGRRLAGRANVKIAGTG